MKYLKKIFEAKSQKNSKELESILDTFIGLEDVYGEPEVESLEGEEKGGYLLSWTIGPANILDELSRNMNTDDHEPNFMDVNNYVKVYTEIFEIYEKFMKIKDDLLSAKGRLSPKFQMAATTTYDEDWELLLLQIKVIPNFETTELVDKIEGKKIYLNKIQFENLLNSLSIQKKRMKIYRFDKSWESYGKYYDRLYIRIGPDEDVPRQDVSNRRLYKDIYQQAARELMNEIREKNIDLINEFEVDVDWHLIDFISKKKFEIVFSKKK